MSSAGLDMHENEAAAKRRQRIAWTVLVALLGLALVARAIFGTTVAASDQPGGKTVAVHSFGTVFVQRTDLRFAQEETKGEDGKTTQVWKRVDGKDPASASSSASVGWTAWTESSPAAYYTAEEANPGQTRILMSTPRTIGLWAAAFFTLAVFSFLIRDNPAYKFTESIVVGVSAAYWMVTAFYDTLVPKLLHPLWPKLVTEYFMPSLKPPEAPPGFEWAASVVGHPSVAFVIALVPLTLGVLLLCRLANRSAWLGIFPLAFIVGTFAGLKFVQFTESDLLAQVATMLNPLVVVKHTAATAAGAAPVVDLPGSVGATVSSLLVFVGVLSVLVYFFFSLEHKGAVGRTARVGIWYLMITFGASFGFTVMGRIALLAARFEFLFDDWLWLIDPANKH